MSPDKQLPSLVRSHQEFFESLKQEDQQSASVKEWKQLLSKLCSDHETRALEHDSCPLCFTKRPRIRLRLHHQAGLLPWQRFINLCLTLVGLLRHTMTSEVEISFICPQKINLKKWSQSVWKINDKVMPVSRQPATINWISCLILTWL